MNKILKILITLLIANIILCICMHSMVVKSIFFDILYKEKYNSREIIKTISNYNIIDGSFDESYLSKNDFTVKLSNIDYDRNNENILKLQLNFSKADNTVLNTVGFLLRVYDDENTIAYQTIGRSGIEDNEYVLYARYYSELLFNEKYYREIKEEFVKVTNERDENCIKKILTIDLPDDYIIKGKLNIDLFNLQYQTIKDSKYYKVIAPLGEFKFIVDFK